MCAVPRLPARRTAITHGPPFFADHGSRGHATSALARGAAHAGALMAVGVVHGQTNLAHGQQRAGELSVTIAPIRIAGAGFSLRGRSAGRGYGESTGCAANHADRRRSGTPRF